jgi:hypothetical protein
LELKNCQFQAIEKTIGIRKPLVPIISKTSKNRRVYERIDHFLGSYLNSFFKLRTRVIYQELGNVIFDNHGYIGELDRVCFEITIGFFLPWRNFSIFFDKEIGKILDFLTV